MGDSFGQILRGAFSTFLLLGRRHWFVLLLIFGFFEVLIVYFENFQNFFHGIAPGSTEQVVADLGGLASTLLKDGFLLLTVPAMAHHGLQNKDFSLIEHWRKNVSQVSIELLRVMASVIRWGILFIVPGLYKHFRYYLVSYVVMFSERYDRGEIDALQASDRIMVGGAIPLLFFLGVTGSLQYLAFGGDAGLSVMEKPFAVVGLDFLSFVFDLYVYTALYSYFMMLLKKNEAAIV